jgi:hypothetical protein
MTLRRRPTLLSPSVVELAAQWLVILELLSGAAAMILELVEG